MPHRNSYTDEQILLFLEGKDQARGQPSGNLNKDKLLFGYKIGTSYVSRIWAMIEAGRLSEEFVQGIYQKFNQKRKKDTPEEEILVFLRGEDGVRGQPSGNMAKDSLLFGYATQVAYCWRLWSLIEAGKLSEEFVKGAYPQFDLPQKKNTPEEDILVFLRGEDEVRGQPSGNMNKDSLLFGYANAGAYAHRLRALIEAGKLSEEYVKQIYRQFLRKHKKETPDKEILVFLRGEDEVRGQPSGKLNKDRLLFGYAEPRGYANRLRRMIKNKKISAQKVGAVYSRVSRKWDCPVLNAKKVREMAEEGFGIAEIAQEMDANAGDVKAHIVDELRAMKRRRKGIKNQESGLEDIYGRLMRGNLQYDKTRFLEVVLACPSNLQEAAALMQTDIAIVIRRLARYARQDVMWFDQTVPAAIKAQMALGPAVVGGEFVAAHTVAANLAAMAKGDQPPVLSPDQAQLAKALELQTTNGR